MQDMQPDIHKSTTKRAVGYQKKKNPPSPHPL